MSANFTPELNSYTDLTPFRYWCQKVLPLVYDDSLSYYELLCKVIDYLNKTMEDVNLAVEDVGKLRDAYDNLQAYVNTYFDNLDVQEEINNKLDEMVEDGTIRNIFSEDVQDILNVASDAAEQAIADIPENVTDWLEEHITQETGYVIDDTLTVQGAAADAKKTGDEISALKSDINTNDLIIYATTNIDPETASNYRAFITASNVWQTGGELRQCGIISIPDDVKKIKVTANATNTSTFAILTTNSHVANETPDYASGWTKPDTLSAGATKTYVVPEDGKYLYYVRTFDGGDRLPQSIEYLTSKFVDIEASVAENTEEINTINEHLTITTPIDPITASNYGAFITVSNIWTASNIRKCGIISIPDDVKKIHVKANAQYNSGFAILTTDSHITGETPDYATGWTAVDTLSTGAEKTYTVPSDGKYLYYTRMFDGGDRLPQSIDYIKMFSADNGITVMPLGLHEMPRNETALNIVKRCRQMTDIRWTPAVDLPRYMLVQRGGVIPDTAESQHYFGTFKAGTEYTGIPYGRVAGTMTEYGYSYATVAHYIPLETFVSSVGNPDSKLCKEDVHSLANHSSVLYATVCSGLTCYALNVPEVSTASIENISGLTQIGKINDNGTEIADSAFKIGDVLNLAGNHTAIVTDIIRDNEGTIQSIELTDASTAGLADRNYSDGQIGGICRRKGWTRAAIYRPGSWGDYTIYRYTGNVPYIPNPYVNVGDEFNMQRIEHFPCMPYEGNKFTYKTGYIPNNAVKILVSLDGYAYLKVFKNGTEISGSPFAVTSETTSIDVTEISAGTYSAYLCNITNGDVVNLTYPCEWTITE